MNKTTPHQRSVIFVDVDNTIISGPFESAVFPIILREMAAKSGLAIDKIRRLIVKENIDRQQDPTVPAIVAMDWDDIVEVVASRLGFRISEKVIDIVRTHARPPYSHVLDDAKSILKQIANPHRVLVAVTKGLAKYQLPILDALELTNLFTDILTPDKNSALKKELAFYGKWPHLTEFQISVGDHYEDDVIAPRAFGFKTIWIPDREEGLNEQMQALSPFERPPNYSYQDNLQIRPDAIILSLQELPKVVEQIEAEYFNRGQSTFHIDSRKA